METLVLLRRMCCSVNFERQDKTNKPFYNKLKKVAKRYFKQNNIVAISPCKFNELTGLDVELSKDLLINLNIELLFGSK